MRQKAFISYSQDDRGVAEALARELESARIDYFFDTKEIRWGDSINNQIDEAIRSSTFIIVIISPSSIRSHWIPFEVGQAMGMGKPILPLVTQPHLELPQYLSGIRALFSVKEVGEYLRSKAWRQASREDSSFGTGDRTENDE